jgi:drug/metabolite transporter (DMT)-like permease
VSTTALFLTPALIWGSTWLAITSQLGAVAPEVSVTYRFALASVILTTACRLTGRSLKFALRDHAFLAGLGLLIITLNYILVYEAERVVASGLVAVAYSTIVFMTPVGMRIAFGVPLEPRLFIAAMLGVAGVALLFLPELERVGQSERVATGVVLTLLAALACAAGNLIAARNHRAGIPTIPATAWTMCYGTLFAALTVLAKGLPWNFDPRWAYVASLAYLAIFGSVVAFATYFTLLKRVGAGRASYVAIATPVIAMLLSTAFEGYRWTLVSTLGAMMAVAGNWLALRLVHSAAVPRETT